MLRRLFALPLLAVLFLGGCLETASPFVPDIETANYDPSLGVNIAASTKTAAGVYYRDIIVGAGTQVPATGSVVANTSYSGYLRSGYLFDEGDFPLTTGTNGSIPGYEDGIKGMRAGGQRQIIIPPHLGYGDIRNGDIPPNSILIFTVTLNSVN